MYVIANIELLKDISVGDTVLTRGLQIPIDEKVHWLKSLSSWVIVFPSDTITLKKDVDAVLVAGELCDIEEEHIFRLNRQTFEMTFECLKDVDYLSEEILKVTKKYVEIGGPAPHDKVDMKTRLMMVSRALNSVFNHHLSMSTELYLKNASSLVEKKRNETQLWLGEVIKEVKKAPGDNALILERLTQLNSKD